VETGKVFRKPMSEERFPVKQERPWKTDDTAPRQLALVEAEKKGVGKKYGTNTYHRTRKKLAVPSKTWGVR